MMLLPVALLLSVYSSSMPAPGPQAAVRPAELEGIGFDQKLNQQLPLHLGFRDEAGRAVQLGNYFGKKPVLLALVYFNCPMLCTLELNGLLRASRAMNLDAGRDYEIVTVSFNPADTPELAAAKKASYLEKYNRAGTAGGWHFLTGDPLSIEVLTRAMGFRYRYDVKSGQYIHASGIVVATPAGRLSRYFYGIEYFPRDVRLALVDASSGRIGTAVDQVLLFCFHYDPATGKYTLGIWRVLQAMCLLTVGMIGGLFIILRRKTREIEARRAGLTKVTSE
jgi:protein SCO1/2